MEVAEPRGVEVAEPSGVEPYIDFADRGAASAAVAAAPARLAGLAVFRLPAHMVGTTRQFHFEGKKNPGSDFLSERCS